MERSLQNSPEIEYRPIGSLTRSPRSARVHNRKKLAKLQKLIERFGQVLPILVDERGEIVDGHAVHEVMKNLGYDEIAVLVVQSRDQENIRALRLALNRLPQEAAWDEEKLRTEFRELVALGFDMELTGFDAVEIDMTLSVDEPAGDSTQEEDAADLEPNGKTVVKPGDIWLLGRHRVACGDARDPSLMARLAEGRSVSAVFTDPPYNVQIGNFVSGLGKTRHREFAMASGEMAREEFIAFLCDFVATAKPNLVAGAILYICMDWRHLLELLVAVERQGLEVKNICVWTKSNAGMGTFYRSQHEMVVVCKHGDAPHQNHFELGQHGRSRSNVWRYAGVNTFGKDRMELLGSHPTVKPTTMISDALKDVTRRGEIVLDCFLGSGSTLIAADETGRICLGVEFDPAYVEVAIRRWQRRTGLDAVNVASGELFDDLCERADDESSDHASSDGGVLDAEIADTATAQQDV